MFLLFPNLKSGLSILDLKPFSRPDMSSSRSLFLDSRSRLAKFIPSFSLSLDTQASKFSIVFPP